MELLGTGGFGEVWLARNPALSALKGAVKFGLDPQARDRLLRHEGALVNRAMEEGKHPNVVQLLDAHLEGDAPWLMYEYVPGGDLTGLIFAWQSLPADERVKRATAALQTLAAAVGHFHRLRPPLVHRDLKPANILVGGTDLKVADFGIGGAAAAASLAQNVSQRSSTGYLASQLWGSHTPLYASPQQQRGDAPDPRDDVHALGVIGFQMLTGKLDAAPGADYAKTLRRLSVPEPLIELLGDCAAHDIDNRPKDATELAGKLAKLTAPRVGPEPTRPRGVGAVPHATDRSGRGVEPPRGPGVGGLLLVFGLLVAVCGGLFVVWRGSFGLNVGPGETLPPRVERGVEMLHTITGVPGRTAHMFFSPGGGLLATVSEDGHVVVWNAPNGDWIATTGKFLNWESRSQLKGHRPAFSPDGTQFAVADSTELLKNAIDIFQAGTTFNNSRTGLADRPAKLAFSPDGQWLAAGGEKDGWVKIWDTAGKLKAIPLSPVTGGETHTLDNAPCGVAAVEFAADGKRLMTAGGNTVRLWRPQAWPNSLEPEKSLTHSDRVTAAALSPDGKWVAAGGASGVTRVWDADKAGKPASEPTTHQKRIRQVAVTADGYAAALDDAGVGVLWSVDNQTQITKLDRQDKRLNAIAFNPAGTLLASASDNKTVRFWDVQQRSPRDDVIQGTHPITAIAFSPDGSRLAAAGAGGTVTVWQVPNPKRKLGD